MYNALEKLRAGQKIEGKDKEIYDQGLIGILGDLLDRIDAAVAEAHGWPADLSEDDILHRLVALNFERAEEEAQGIIRWLRPDYQNPKGTQATTGKQTELDVGTTEKVEKAHGPKSCPNKSAPYNPPCAIWARPPPTKSPAALLAPAHHPSCLCWKALLH
jgi:hypothetical protein